MEDYTLKGLVTYQSVYDKCTSKIMEDNGYFYIDFKNIIRNPEYSAMIYSGEIDNYIEELLKEKPYAHITISEAITDQKNKLCITITKDKTEFSIYESMNVLDCEEDINRIATSNKLYADKTYSLEEILTEYIEAYPNPDFVVEFDPNKTYTLDYIIQSYYRTYPKIDKYRKFKEMIDNLKSISTRKDIAKLSGLDLDYDDKRYKLLEAFKEFKYKPYYCQSEKELKKYLVDAVNATIKILDKKSLELTQFATNLYN